MLDPIAELAEGFTPPDRTAWLALVSKTLKGADVQSLTRRTEDGLPVHALYGPADAAASPGRRSAGWDVRVAVCDPSPAEANQQALEALQGGAASILLTLGDFDAADLARALAGVETDIAPVALDAGDRAVEGAALLDQVAKASPAAPLAFHFDPFTALAGDPGLDVEARLTALAGAGARLAQVYPRASLFLASGQVVHEAGGGSAQELAFAAAAALACARASLTAGLPVEEAFGRIVLGLAVDADVIGSIAKVRAGRRLVERLGALSGAPGAARIEARSSARMLARASHWTNLVRLTAAGFAAAVGGADALVLQPFDAPLGTSGPLARRQARNIQLILAEEAGLGRVADPAAGAWALEAQTEALARLAWERLQGIEAAGGLAAAIRSGAVARDVAAARAELARSLAERERRIVGVTDFREAQAPDAPAAAAPSDGLAPIRLEDLLA